MANKTRKRSSKKIDKELNQLLKEKNKIDDLTVVKEKKNSSKKKDAVVTPERKKKTTKKKESVVVPERRSVSKTKKKSSSRSVAVTKEDKEKLKQSRGRKKADSVANDNKKIKARAVIVNEKEKDSLKQSRSSKKVKARAVIVNALEKEKIQNYHETEIIDSQVEDSFISEMPVVEEPVIIHTDICDEIDDIDVPTFENTNNIDLDNKVSTIDSVTDLFRDDNEKESFQKFEELENEMRNLYEKSSHEEKTNDDQTSLEDSGVLVMDSAIVNHEEYFVKKRSALTIISIILFVIFMLLFIAFIAFVIYVCTY